MTDHTAPASYLAEPTIQYLFQVLEQIRVGEVQFPRFQRFGVWKPDRRRELLRSIVEGIPIGTLLIWRTSLTTVKIQRRIGLHELPAQRPRERVHQYVLDGVQRLSTLFGALYPPAPSTALTADDGERVEDFRVYYDLDEEDFYAESDLEKTRPLPHHLPLTAIRDSVQLIRFQRLLRGEKAEVWTERADSVARAFREYKIPVVPLASDDLAHATKTFQRINTQGVPMSEIHMVNALSYEEDFDLLERIREAKQEHLSPLGWEGIEDDTILRTIKAMLEIDVYASRPDETREAMRARPGIVEEASEALVSAAKFLAKHWHIKGPDLVPYSAQIVLLARTVKQVPRRSARANRALRDWIALTTYTEMFAGNMSASRFNVIAKELVRAAKGEHLEWSVRRPLTRRGLPPGFDFRHARARFLALRMARAGARDPIREDSDPFGTLASLGVLGVPQLITSKMAPRGGDWMRSPGARFIVAEGSLSALRQRLLAHDAQPALLSSHIVSPAVHQRLVANRFEEAVRLREQELNEAERQDFRELLAGHPPLLQAAAAAERLSVRA